MKLDEDYKADETRFRTSLQSRDFNSVLDNIFDENGESRKKPEATPKEESPKKPDEKPKDPLSYKGDRVHFFPENPKAPYFTGRDVPLGRYGPNVLYTVNFIMDLELAKKRKAECSKESLTDRTYMALMALEKIVNKDRPHIVCQNLMVLEDAIVPDIAKRYGWQEENARWQLHKGVDAMEQAFQIQNGLLLKLFKQIYFNGNGRNGNGKNGNGKK